MMEQVKGTVPAVTSANKNTSIIESTMNITSAEKNTSVTESAQTVRSSETNPSAMESSDECITHSLNISKPSELPDTESPFNSQRILDEKVCSSSKPYKSPMHQPTESLSAETLRDRNVALLKELECERKLIKTLRREKSYEVQQARDTEQKKALVAYKDLQTKLHTDKLKALELVKENLNRKFLSDMQKVTRQKDAELTKVRTEWQKCQSDLKELHQQTKANRGLSASTARDTFDLELTKLLQENQELKNSRSILEQEVSKMKASMKQKTADFERYREETRLLAARDKKKTDMEVKKLLEEIRLKDHHISQLEQGKTRSSNAASQLLTIVHLDRQPTINVSGGQPSQAKHSSTQTDAGGGTTLSEDSCTQTNVATPTEDLCTQTDGATLCEDSCTQTNVATPTEDFCTQTDGTTLCEDFYGQTDEPGSESQEKLRELDKKYKACIDANKEILAKNIQVTQKNRCLEEELDALRNQVCTQSSGQETQLEALQEEIVEQNKALSILRMACQEKDRRIDLLVHKRQKAKKKIYAQKVVRFLLPAKGLLDNRQEADLSASDDDASQDSGIMSTFSGASSGSSLGLDTSLGEDDVFDQDHQVLKNDLEENFHRLSKERLELERAHAQLYDQLNQRHDDNPLEDQHEEERERLNTTIRLLKEKIKNQEQHEGRMVFRIREAMEANDDLEFRILELEEQNEKLTESLSKDTCHDLGQEEDGADETPHMKLKDLTVSNAALQERVKLLDAEKKELMAKASSTEQDFKTQQNEMQEKMSEAEKKIHEYQEMVEKYKKEERVHALREERSAQAEADSRHLVDKLQRQLDSSTEGRQYEAQLWQENTDKLRRLEQNESALNEQIKTMSLTISDLEAEKSKLTQALLVDENEKSQSQSDKDERISLLEDKCHRLKEELKDSCHHLQEQLDGKNQEMETMTKQLQEKSTSIEDLEKKVHLFKNTSKISREKIQELSGKNRRLSSELESLQENKRRPEQLDALETQLTEARDKNNELVQRIQELQNLSEHKDLALEELTSGLKLKESTVDELTAELKLKESAVEELTARLKLKESAIGSLNEDRNALRKEVDICLTERRQSEEQSQQLKTQNQTLIDKIMSLEHVIRELRAHEVKMQDSMSLLQQESGRRVEDLQQLVDQMADKEQHMEETITTLKNVTTRSQTSTGSQTQDNLQDVNYLTKKVNTLELAELKLLDQIEILENSQAKLQQGIRSFKERDAKSGSDVKSEDSVKSKTKNYLQDKVDILLDTEEKLLTRLNEQEIEEERLKSGLKQKVETIEALHVELNKLDTKCDTLLENMKGLNKMNLSFQEAKANDSKVIAELRVKNENLEQSLALSYDQTESMTSKQDFVRRMCDLERTNEILREKLSQLESQKHKLLEVIAKSAHRSQNTQRETESMNTGGSEQVQITTPHGTNQDEELQRLSRDELIVKISKLENAEQLYISRIKKLSEDFATFRQAVQVAAVTMETDVDTPIHTSKSQNTNLQCKVQELLSSEVTLKIQNLGLKKQEANLRAKLREAEQMVKRQSGEYRIEVEQLETELDEARKSQARLKNELRYGEPGRECHALAKISHLEDLVFDLEASERKLRRHLQDSQDSEQDLREGLFQIQHGLLNMPRVPAAAGVDVVAEVDAWKTDTLHQLSDICHNTADSDRSIWITRLEAAQQRLQRQQELLETDKNAATDDNMPHSQEDFLTQRITNLTKMENYLSQQVVELEQDREELYRVTRQDKRLLHELSVQLAQSQASAQSLNQQLTQLVASEAESRAHADHLESRLTDTQRALNTSEGTNRRLAAQLNEAQRNSENLTQQLDDSESQLRHSQNALSRQTTQADSQRKVALLKENRMAQQISQLEDIQINLSQKIKTLEGREKALRTELTHLESTSQNRIDDLQTTNTQLSEKISRLEEERKETTGSEGSLTVNESTSGVSAMHRAVWAQAVSSGTGPKTSGLRRAMSRARSLRPTSLRRLLLENISEQTHNDNVPGRATGSQQDSPHDTSAFPGEKRCHEAMSLSAPVDLERLEEALWHFVENYMWEFLTLDTSSDDGSVLSAESITDDRNAESGLENDTSTENLKHFSSGTSSLRPDANSEDEVSDIDSEDDGATGPHQGALTPCSLPRTESDIDSAAEDFQGSFQKHDTDRSKSYTDSGIGSVHQSHGPLTEPSRLKSREEGTEIEQSHLKRKLSSLEKELRRKDHLINHLSSMLRFLDTDKGAASDIHMSRALSEEYGRLVQPSTTYNITEDQCSARSITLNGCSSKSLNTSGPNVPTTSTQALFSDLVDFDNKCHLDTLVASKSAASRTQGPKTPVTCDDNISQTQRSHSAVAGQTQTPLGRRIYGRCKRAIVPLPKLVLDTFKSPAFQRFSGAPSGAQGGAQSPPPVDHVQSSLTATPVRGPPEPPTNLSIERVLGNHSILLSWTPPTLDQFARSNGLVVKGYKLAVNGHPNETLPSPHMSKALVECLDVPQVVRVGIQTAAQNGLLSRLVEVMCDDTNRTAHTDAPPLRWDTQDTASGTQDNKRVFLAVYDYKSKQERSHDDGAAHELSFRTGDMIVIMGNVRDDGYYHGKLRGRRGLVPARFVEEIAVLRFSGKMVTNQRKPSLCC